MDEAQRAAFNEIFDAGEKIREVIVRSRAFSQPLYLPLEIVAKLVEAQQALFAAQRLMEKL